MQLTRLDRWLRERFVYETHIYTLRPPENVPAGVILEELAEAPGRRFRHRMVVRQESLVPGIVARLQASSQAFTTRVVDRDVWYAPLLAPSNQSATWRLVWLVLTVVGAVFFIRLGIRLWQTETFQGLLRDLPGILEGK